MMNYVRQEILPPYRKQDLRISVSPAAIISGGGMSAGRRAVHDRRARHAKARPVLAAGDADLRDVPGAVDVDSSLVVGKPQYGVDVDRAKAADLGV